MVSVDARRAGFNGVALGRTQVYGTAADAVCVQSPRHRCPSSWCDCGFYCFHALDEARGLACDPQYPYSVVLDVLASGRFISYERGLRYARQTVRGVRVGRCDCGCAAEAFVGAATGVIGWRRLTPVCAPCAGNRPVLSLEAFGLLAGEPDAPLPVRVDEAIDDTVFAPLPRLRGESGAAGAEPSRRRDGAEELGPELVDETGPSSHASPHPGPGPRPDADLDEASLVSLLTAEVALLQARLDEVQDRIDRLTRRRE